MCKSKKGKKQTGLEKMLVKIADRKGNNLVDARELHKVLQIGSDFTTWFERMVGYGFIEGKDFICFSSEKKKNIYGDYRGRPQINFAITTRMAEHICLVQKNEIGMICRQFLMDVSDLFFQMMLRSNDKAFQKECMAKLRKLIPDYEERKLKGEAIVDFATANKVVNKIVSDYFGIHYCNKSEMPKEMLEIREEAMQEYLVLYKFCDSTEEIETKLKKVYPKSDTQKARSNYDRPIKDLTTNKIYACAGKASRDTGIAKDKIIKNCNGDVEKVNKEHRFIYYEFKRK